MPRHAAQDTTGSLTDFDCRHQQSKGQPLLIDCRAVSKSASPATQRKSSIPDLAKKGNPKPLQRTITAKMSRFFHGGASDSESSSSDEEELYSDREEEEASEEEESSEEEEVSEEEESSEEEGGPRGAGFFLKGAEEAEESEEEERVTVVKSAKDKRIEELEGTVKLIENAEKIGDWAVISTGKAWISCYFDSVHARESQRCSFGFSC